MKDSAVSGSTALPELSLRAILLGALLSVVMGAANVYLGLKAGMTVSASIPAAVVGMLILRGLFRNGSILEANQVQTAASAGESLAAGIIFTMPALVMIGVWKDFDLVMTTLIAFTGGMLGILFMIPMRRVFVVPDDPELRFPEAQACASVLKAGDASGSRDDAMAVVQGAGVGALFKLLLSFFGLFKNTLEGATVSSSRIFYYGSDLSPALLAVGFIVGAEVSVLIFFGGALAWLVGIPLLGQGEAFLADPLAGAWELWTNQIRYVGVGAMVVGGIASIYKVRAGLVQAIRELRRGASPAAPDGGEASPLDRDISSKAILSMLVMCIGLMIFLYYDLLQHWTIALVSTLIMLVMAFFFTAVASYIVGLVGNSNSPVSGMTITAVLFTGGMLSILGFSGTDGMVATLGVAAVVCCVTCTSGDVCNDLKTGRIVGASPFRQQIMEIIGVAVGALVMAPVLNLLHNNTPGGIGGRELSAPQAGLFASLARGFFGDGALPWDMVGLGAGLGVLLLVIDRALELRESPLRLPLMPVAVGMYLPFGLGTPILLGGIFAWWIARKTPEAQREHRLQRGVLLSSGLIAGESLMGVGIAVLASIGIARYDLGLTVSTVNVLSVLGSTALLIWFYRKARAGSAV